VVATLLPDVTGN